jgi:hypothetical protein
MNKNEIFEQINSATSRAELKCIVKNLQECICKARGKNDCFNQVEALQDVEIVNCIQTLNNFFAETDLGVKNKFSTIKNDEGHKLTFCTHCDYYMITCAVCGNNTCNGTSGIIDGQACQSCESAYSVFRQLYVKDS